MKISKKWLEQYMNLDGLSMEDIAKAITDAGFEVEEIIPLSQGDNLVIGQVLTCEDHPDSDHLHVTTVNIGDEVLNIVCGAPNVKTGQKVIVAKAGARLPGGVIKKGMIRNQESNGMICALFELGVDKHMLREDQIAGIEILDENAPVGHPDPLGYLGYDDVVLDVSLTPNRSDCMAEFSMAKEIGAIINRPVRLPSFEGAAKAGEDVETRMHVTSQTEGCPLFLAKVIGSVTIKESPEWMKELLRAAGMHSINNVVDISNIVMLETGQPMHFYDIEAIKDFEITVKEGLNEPYTALDGVEYQLEPSDLVITNQNRPIGIAGIMGGDDSKILDTTSGLIIECASFDHVRIRNTARRLNLATESSLRYQKGIEPLAPYKALDRAVQLLIEYADAKDIEKTVSFCTTSWQPKEIETTLDKINARLGTDFSLEEVLDVFERLDFNPVVENDLIRVTIPSTRSDVEGMADLSEEVIRMIGYDRLEGTLPLMEMTEGKLTEEQKQKRLIEKILLENGVQDAITYTLVSDAKNENAILSCGEAITLASPLSEERKNIRTSILPSLLEAAAWNIAHGNKDVHLFEISDLESKENNTRHLAVVLNGTLSQTRWLKDEVPADFYMIKGLVEEILERSGINANMASYKENKMDTVHFHPYRSAVLKIGKKPVAIFGQIHPEYAGKTGLENAVMLEMDLHELLNAKKSKVKFTPASRYPAVKRDLSFIVDKNLPASKIIDIIKRNGRLNKEAVVRNVEIFDVYTGEHVKDNEKSIAFTLEMRSDKQTLKEEDIKTVFDGIIEAISKEAKATLRSN